MPSNSGEGKILRAIAQLENVEILLGGLPKRFGQPGERKTKLKALLSELTRIQNEIKKLYKEELSNFEEGE